MKEGGPALVDRRLLKEAQREQVLFAATVVFAVGAAAAVLWQTWSVAVIVNGLFLEKADAMALRGAFLTALAALALRILLEALEEGAACAWRRASRAACGRGSLPGSGLFRRCRYMICSRGSSST